MHDNRHTLISAALNSVAMPSFANQAPASFSSITPTPAERAAGRLMRAPDHDAGTGGGGDGGAAGTGGDGTGDGGAGTGAADDKGGADKGDADSDKIDLGEGEGGSKADDPPVDETPEQKAEREAKEAGDAERAELFGAPEGDAAYEIIGLPEGTEVDTEALAAITPIAKQLGLSSKGLSLIAATYAEKVLPRVAQQATDQINTQITEQRTAWENEARDAISGKVELKNKAGEKIDFGGKDLKGVQQVAAKALDRLAPEGFREFLNDSGLGVNPAMIAFCFNAGLAIAEDKVLEPGGSDGDKPKSRTEKYYPAT